MQVATGTVGLSRDRHAFAISDRARRPLATCRSPSLSRRVELTQASRLLQRTHPRTAARCFPTRKPVHAKRRLPWSSRSLFTTQTSGVHVVCRRPSPTLRSVLGVPPALDGLLHHRPRGLVSSHSRVQGFPFRVFPSQRSRTGSLRPRALLPFLHRRPAVACAKRPCLDFKALLPAEVR
jgi:hypothetical protein